jgi:phosphohistidine phosphatase
MERTLVLLRHAKSDWDSEEADLDRPLARRGQREAPDAGRWIAGNLPVLDLAVVSPARRTQETWQLVVAELTSEVPMRMDDRIYEASVHDLLDVVRDLPAEAASAIIVGHNPGLEELVRLLTGRVVPMPTSAMAVLTTTSPWVDLARATLVAAGRPPVPPK